MKNNSGNVAVSGSKEEGTRTVFSQMVSRATSLNAECLLLPHRVWKVKFVGESVDDCGGGYSESIAEMCDELNSSTGTTTVVAPPLSNNDITSSGCAAGGGG